MEGFEATTTNHPKVHAYYNKLVESTTQRTTKQHFCMKYYGEMWRVRKPDETLKWREIQRYEDVLSSIPDDEVVG